MAMKEIIPGKSLQHPLHHQQTLRDLVHQLSIKCSGSIRKGQQFTFQKMQMELGIDVSQRITFPISQFNVDVLYNQVWNKCTPYFKTADEVCFQHVGDYVVNLIAFFGFNGMPIDNPKVMQEVRNMIREIIVRMTNDHEPKGSENEVKKQQPPPIIPIVISDDDDDENAIENAPQDPEQITTALAIVPPPTDPRRARSGSTSSRQSQSYTVPKKTPDGSANKRKRLLQLFEESTKKTAQEYEETLEGKNGTVKIQSSTQLTSTPNEKPSTSIRRRKHSESGGNDRYDRYRDRSEDQKGETTSTKDVSKRRKKSPSSSSRIADDFTPNRIKPSTDSNHNRRNSKQGNRSITKPRHTSGRQGKYGPEEDYDADRMPTWDHFGREQASSKSKKHKADLMAHIDELQAELHARNIALFKKDKDLLDRESEYQDARLKAHGVHTRITQIEKNLTAVAEDFKSKEEEWKVEKSRLSKLNDDMKQKVAYLEEEVRTRDMKLKVDTQFLLGMIDSKDKKLKLLEKESSQLHTRTASQLQSLKMLQDELQLKKDTIEVLEGKVKHLETRARLDSLYKELGM